MYGITASLVYAAVVRSVVLSRSHTLVFHDITRTHNEVNHAFGDDTPVTFTTEGSWDYIDAYLTEKGIHQCITARETLLQDAKPQLIVVSPFTRTLQTAHIMFAGKGM